MKKFLTTILAFVLLVSLISCGNKTESETDTATAQATSGSAKIAYNTGVSYELSGNTVALAGITFTPAKEWTDLGPSMMRKASYTFGPVENDADSATLTVFYFGPDQGGSIESNLARWINQMSLADGSDPATVAVFDKTSADGMNVHLVNVEGIYNASVGRMMGGETVAKDGYIMLGAVVEGPEGNVFFKLTGPKTSAEQMAEGFMAMLNEIKKS